mgnify:CR=1 FL=1
MLALCPQKQKLACVTLTMIGAHPTNLSADDADYADWTCALFGSVSVRLTSDNNLCNLRNLRINPSSH